MEAETLKRIREQIHKAEEGLAAAEKDIADARRAGIDVTEMEKRRDELRRNILRLKAVYGK